MFLGEANRPDGQGTRMIVIKASGVSDVRRLRKLADTLDAEDIPDIPSQPAVEARTPSVSTNAGARITPRTRAAILALQPVEEGIPGEYEMP
jgi:hypothetical protein